MDFNGDFPSLLLYAKYSIMSPQYIIFWDFEIQNFLYYNKLECHLNEMVCFYGVLTFFEINVDWSFVFTAGKSDTNNISFMLQLSCNGIQGSLNWYNTENQNVNLNTNILHFIPWIGWFRFSWLFNKILQWDFKYISLHHASLCWLCKKQFCLTTLNLFI